MHLLEREAPLASLAEYAQEARHGDGRLVLVAGEAGVGKSALVERLESDLPDARWFWGACDGLFTPRPLGPLFDLAGQLGGELQDLCRARAGREELFSALLRQINEPGALNVVVIEDLHWADESTVDLLRFLGRRIRGVPVLLIGTYRDDGLAASDPLRLAIGELATQRSTRRIGLPRLTARAVRRLADGTGLEAAELYRLTGGNPFYVTEVVRSGMDAIPPSARDAVLARAARLSCVARDVLDGAALVGATVDLPLLRSVMECSAEVLDELLASGLLAGDGTRLKFRHELARLAVEDAIADHRRGVIHARILDALYAQGCDDDATMASHAEAAGDGPAVLRHAPAAARRASELDSHRVAFAQYERALRYADDTDWTTTAGLYDAFANEASLVDRWQEAADARAHALDLWRAAGDRLREGDTLRGLSRTMARLCRGQDAIDAGEAAVSILEPLGPSSELARAYANLANQRMTNAELDDAIDLALRAQALAEPLDEFEVQSDALNTEGCANFSLHRGWIEQMHRALEIATSRRLDEQAGRAFSNLYSLHCSQRSFNDAERYYVEGVSYCDEYDVVGYGSCLRGGRADMLEKMGRWDESVAMIVKLLARADASPSTRLGPLIRLGAIRARRGDPSAWRCLDEAMTTALATGEPQLIVPVRLARAEAYWLDEKHRSAQQEVELADASCANCDPWERGAVAVWLRRTKSSRPPQGVLAEPYRLQIDGEHERAAQLWTDLNCPYDTAMTLLDQGDEASLRQALGIFQNLGATASAQIARQNMRRLGVRSIPAGARTATRAHPLGLTRREHEVLDLIVDGHTNAQIGMRLFISTKTVDHHVSAVLAKLGAPTRNIAAAEAVRLGLVSAANG